MFLRLSLKAHCQPYSCCLDGICGVRQLVGQVVHLHIGFFQANSIGPWSALVSQATCARKAALGHHTLPVRIASPVAGIHSNEAPRSLSSTGLEHQLGWMLTRKFAFSTSSIIIFARLAGDHMLAYGFCTRSVFRTHFKVTASPASGNPLPSLWPTAWAQDKPRN